MSACTPDVIGLLPCLLVYRAPGREGQCFPFGQCEHVPKLGQKNLIEVLIDSACQIWCLACRLRCHSLPLLLFPRIVSLDMIIPSKWRAVCSKIVRLILAGEAKFA